MAAVVESSTHGIAFDANQLKNQMETVDGIYALIVMRVVINKALIEGSISWKKPGKTTIVITMDIKKWE